MKAVREVANVTLGMFSFQRERLSHNLGHVQVCVGQTRKEENPNIECSLTSVIVDSCDHGFVTYNFIYCSFTSLFCQFSLSSKSDQSKNVLAGGLFYKNRDGWLVAPKITAPSSWMRSEICSQHAASLRLYRNSQTYSLK